MTSVIMYSEGIHLTIFHGTGSVFVPNIEDTNCSPALPLQIFSSCFPNNCTYATNSVIQYLKLKGNYMEQCINKYTFSSCTKQNHSPEYPLPPPQPPAFPSCLQDSCHTMTLTSGSGHHVTVLSVP